MIDDDDADGGYGSERGAFRISEVGERGKYPCQMVSMLWAVVHVDKRGGSSSCECAD